MSVHTHDPLDNPPPGARNGPGASTSTPAVCDPRVQTRQNAKRPGMLWLLFTLIFAGAIFGVLFYLGWIPQLQRHERLDSASRQLKTGAPRVAVIRPKLGAPLSELLLPGEIQAVREAVIYARTSGYVKKWNVDMGDSVKEAQELAEIDSPEVDKDLEHARANVEQSQAALEQSRAAVQQSRAQLLNGQAAAELADLTLKRYNELRGTAAITEQQLSETETAAKVAHAVVTANQAAVGASEAAVSTAQANVKVAKADVARLEVMKSFEHISAPFMGTITARYTETGALITSGSGSGAQPLFRLACTDPVRVFIDVPQTHAPSIQIGLPVNLLVREYAAGKFNGKVTRTSRAIDPTSRTMRAEVQVPNPKGELLSGMYAQVTFGISSVTPPLLLPSSVLVVNSQGTQVALVKDGKVHFQRVTIEGDYGANFGVSAGLSPEDIVIANPGERLTEGLAVSIVETMEHKTP